uniref:Uncharacterized protein n=1 Tax=Oryza barthii TaxID=65489 RepID=A0A0D3GJU6_9ORYZ
MALHLQSIGPLARFRLSTHTYQGQPGLFETTSPPPPWSQPAGDLPLFIVLVPGNDDGLCAFKCGFGARLPPKVASNTNAELSSPPKLLKCVEVYPPDPVL